MQEIERDMSEGLYSLFTNELQRVVEKTEKIPYACMIVRATAAQRAEAFLRTLDLWETDTP
jgi:hypothetical protein